MEGLIAEAVDELLLALAGGLEVALEVDVVAPQTLEEAGENVLHLLPHHRVGHVGGDHLDQRVDHPVSRCEGGLDLLDGTEATGDVGLQLFDGVELGDVLHPLVGDPGEAPRAHFLDEHLEGHLLSGPVPESLGQLVIELEDLAGTLPLELGVELGNQRPATHPVKEVGRGRARHLLVVDGAADVDGDEVTFGRSDASCGSVG